jgi:hypothetical protein
MVEHEDAFFTFSDEDFERRYASDETALPAGGSRPAAQQTTPFAAKIVRSRNRYMRTLLRRRLAATGAS